MSAADGAGPMRIAVLGPLEVWRGDVALVVNSRTQRALLVRLALAAGAIVGQDELIALLWPRQVPANAAGLLHTRMARLRRLLEPANASAPVVVAAGTGYRLTVDVDGLDLLAFRDLTARATREAAAFALLSEAVALWRGETDVEQVLADPAYVAVFNEYVAAVRAFARLARDLGQPEVALERLRALANRDELDEPLHVDLIRTLDAAGRQAEALNAYDRIRTALAEHLGINPSETLREAHLAVLRRHEAPQHTNFPPHTRGERGVVQQVPSAPPDFVGRAGELDAIRTALGRRGLSSRVVLIDGVAGVGKTALALTAAHRLREEYPDGQLYADLRGNGTATTAPLQVLTRFLRALGVPGRRIGTDEAEAAALLRSELADRRMLLLLDNARDAAQVRPLLPGAGQSDAIVTSRRQLLDLEAAGVVSLQPLSHEDAVALITSTSRAPEVGTDSEGIDDLAEACARLPLALRIAGARLATRRGWTVADLARRLDDSNRRLSELSLGESSVLNSFQLSYADLAPDAQRAFRLCSLHPGDDFSADSTAALLDVPVPTADRVLEDLLGANMLLQHSRNRYRFHDLLGLYARRLVATDDESESARSRLHEWYAETVTAAVDVVHPQLVRLSEYPAAAEVFQSAESALEWLDEELPALLAVVQDDGASLAWRIADQLRGYYLLRRDAEGWLPAAQAGMAAATAAGDDFAKVAMLINRGQALGAVGRDEDAMSDCLAGHALAVAVGRPIAAAYLAHQVGWLQLERGKLDDAEHWMSRALELTDTEPRGHVRAIALNGLGMVRLYAGALQKAADLFTSALEISEHGLETSRLTIRGNLAGALRQSGATERAAELLSELMATYHQRSQYRGESSTLDEWARLHSRRGDGAAALQTALRAHELAKLVRDPKAQAQTASAVAQAQLTLGDPAAALEWIEACLAIARDTYPYLEAEALLTLASAQLATGDHSAAALSAEQAALIAKACGFELLAAEAGRLSSLPDQPL
ncbi:BTAD domain-containing putative transcriptional regulator [Kribbella sp. NPDC048915]|uniref:AfsR/SARP family transcriptional regulator n=1 Tax=Kribbella sp. NPDC048915 TaxID=3155148 RepID=UPI00340124ED